MFDGEYHDEEQLREACDQFVREFIAEQGEELAGEVDRLVDVKCNYLGGAPDEWGAHDVAEVLFEIYPAKVMLEPGRVSRVPVAAAALLRFLAQRDPDQSDGYEGVAQHIEKSAVRFGKAMADDSNWSFGKRMWSTAQAEGVDFEDEKAVGAWIEQFNRRTRAERDRVLDPKGQTVRQLDSSRHQLPPIVLPTEDELAEALDRSVMLDRLVKLVDFVGDGRPADDMGDFTPWDTEQLRRLFNTGDSVEGLAEELGHHPTSGMLPELSLIVELALAIDLLTFGDVVDTDDELDEPGAEAEFGIEIEDSTIVPGPEAHLADSPSVELAEAVLQSLLVDTGPVGIRDEIDARYGMLPLADGIDGQMLEALYWLYEADAPIPVDTMGAHMWEALGQIFDMNWLGQGEADGCRKLVTDDTRYALLRFAELGVVRVFDVIVMQTPTGESRSGGRVELDHLGRLLLNRMAVVAADAPVAGALTDVDAADLLRVAVELPDGLAQAEVAHWLSSGGETSAGALILAMVDAASPERSLAYRSLVTASADGRSICEQLERAGSGDVALMFAVDTEQFLPEDIDRSTDAQEWVELMATVAALASPEAAAVGWAEQIAAPTDIFDMLEGAWRVEGDATEAALGAVGSSHPDKLIAKAARKALFKLRSAT